MWVWKNSSEEMFLAYVGNKKIATRGFVNLHVAIEFYRV